MAYGNASNVSAGKPNVAGAVYYGATNLTAPTTANGSLAAGFKDVGYISDAGVTNSNTRTSESVKAWGGDTVLNTQKEKTDTFTSRCWRSLTRMFLQSFTDPRTYPAHFRLESLSM